MTVGNTASLRDDVLGDCVQVVRPVGLLQGRRFRGPVVGVHLTTVVFFLGGEGEATVVEVYHFQKKKSVSAASFLTPTGPWPSRMRCRP